MATSITLPMVLLLLIWIVIVKVISGPELWRCAEDVTLLDTAPLLRGDERIGLLVVAAAGRGGRVAVVDIAGVPGESNDSVEDVGDAVAAAAAAAGYCFGGHGVGCWCWCFVWVMWISLVR